MDYSSIAFVPYDTSTLEISTADFSGASSNLFSLSSSYTFSDTPLITWPF